MFVTHRQFPLTLSSPPLSPFLDCVWPHYASRLVMELWQHHGERLYVRLVYNGEDLTALIPSCANPDLLQEGQATFCLLQNFFEQIDRILSPHRNRKKACQDQRLGPSQGQK
jgi:hypothetical protein